MSVQFGRWNFSGQPSEQAYLDQARRMLAPYGPDGGGLYSGRGVDIIYRAFHTTKESRLEKQPRQLPSGAVLTWDGRLDNREELIRQLRSRVTLESSDAAVAGAAYERWGTASFAKLIGDWALSVWDPIERALLLAKDFLGTRRLFYACDSEKVTWSTILDPLVLLGGRSLRLEGEYIAGWLSFFPAPHLTPYAGIYAVPPSTFIHFGSGKAEAIQYWNFDAHKKIRYSTDGEYEDHFRAVFGESVIRRLRSDAPVLAELSGGMDSSSIVCMADRIISQGAAGAQRLDTVSYYSESEPNWNERPFFTKVEEQRGSTGCHIDVSSQDGAEFESDSFAATPGHVALHSSEAKRQFAEYLISRGSRIVLSGIGGDEVIGGVPTPGPHLEDLLARIRVKDFAKQLKAWALTKRRPWLHLLLEAGQRFFPPGLAPLPKHRLPPLWLQPDFVSQQRKALTGYPSRLRLFDSLPSFQENLLTLRALQRQLGNSVLPSNPLYEVRYPYLDRDLLEFLYAIPREQLVRPTQRRSLMRRAMAGIVPGDLLNRKRKAFVTRTPATLVAARFTRLIEASGVLVSSKLGIIDAQAFCREAERARSGQDVPIVGLMRALQIEFWLRALAGRGLLSGLAPSGQRELRKSQNAELCNAPKVDPPGAHMTVTPTKIRRTNVSGSRIASCDFQPAHSPERKEVKIT
jgi:asparagine synthase (glutamine-hydrolysing)